ncbi:MAG: 2-C-methyl-D-erythritol 2,4-cyclodiphosphate synthase [Bacteroidales bacterium]|nr:2-C-methyl-D-erythritol 2,4-cyclodiphosphate synthase [Bacteroidales bacterium]
MDIRVGNGYDVHQLADGLRLVIGGVEIEHTKGCVAHSDGDVAIHALCDAILGSLALGDIGKHFPDTSSEFKGIDSKILLARVMELVWERGYVLGNADITIAAQKPKMAPHLLNMRETMAAIMKVDTDRVSVKATTTEKLGFVGREEGIEVWASVIVLKK